MKKYVFLSVIFAVLAVIFISHINKSTEVFSNGISLPVIMYHSVIEDEKKDSDYILSTRQLEEDIIYLKNNGYTPVTCRELIMYTQSSSILPPKPVLLTFDDGMLNNFTLALPILEKHGFNAVFSVVGSYTDEYSENKIRNNIYSYATWQDLSALYTNHYVELGNHSYDMHTIKDRYGTQKKKGESFFTYLEAFYSDTERMQNEFFYNCNYRPVIYTYPFGEFCKDSERILKKNGYLVTFSCIEGVNKITKNPDCLYLLKRYNRSGKLSTAEFFNKINL